ncbi:(Fe-S)-binding protein [Alkalibacillus aidingensis]|uniref:(Fe-S)-binding protein n=1 Tax=Alkalibacillus aidingensis TaxID=2747607 RepID=UPI001660E6C9|nr:(Fe-S)-binding protein [Alkalibacillus aidingensis]
MRVSLFITCLSDIFYPEVGKDVVEVLERNGCQVDFPMNQTCCGQPAFNSGYRTEAKESAKHMISVFEDAEYVVSPSGSCVAMLKEYPHLFDEGSELRKRAQQLANKSYEFTQFLVYVLKKDDVQSSFHKKVTYHTSCHMTRLLGEKEAPFRLMEHVEGMEYVPLHKSYECCGFGGTFSVKMPSISNEMVEEKVRNIEESGADYLIGADCSCLMNIEGKLKRKGSHVEVMHIAELLNHSSKEGDHHGNED